MQIERIISGCKNNDRKCQRALVDLYSGMLFTVCRRYFSDDASAQDALQEGLIRILKSINTYSESKGNLVAWMRRIVVNECLRIIKKRGLHFEEVNEYLMVVDDSANALDLLHEEDLIRLINQLPDGYREVFNMNVIDAYTHKEIAKILNIKESTSRSQLTRAKKILQKQILKVENIGLCRMIK